MGLGLLFFKDLFNFAMKSSEDKLSSINNSSIKSSASVISSNIKFKSSFVSLLFVLAHLSSKKDMTNSGAVDDLVKVNTELPLIVCPPTRFALNFKPFTNWICSIPCLNNPLPT